MRRALPLTMKALNGGNVGGAVVLHAGLVRALCGRRR
jgi:hypothetical protein